MKFYRELYFRIMKKGWPFYTFIVTFIYFLFVTITLVKYQSPLTSIKIFASVEELSDKHPRSPIALLLSNRIKAEWYTNPPRHFSLSTGSGKPDLERNLTTPSTTIDVFSGGHCHFRRLYVFNDTFYIVRKATTIGHSVNEPILTLLGDEFRIADCFPPNISVRIVTLEELEQIGFWANNTSVQIWDSNTYISIQTPGFSWLPHYAHLIEEILGAWLMLQTVAEDHTLSSTLGRLLFLGDSKAEKDSPKYMFQDGSVARILLAAVFGKTSIFGAKSLREFRSIRIDSAMTSCREQAFHNDLLGNRYKLVLVGLCHVLWSAERIRQFQLSVYKALEIKPTPSYSDRPVVFYVDRQNTQRRLVDSVHDQLLIELESLKLEGWEVLVKRMEDIPFAEQVSISRRAHVILGVHGNGLTTVLWAEPGACLVEFHGSMRRFNFQWLSQVVGMNYVAVDEYGVESSAKYIESEWKPTVKRHKSVNITIDPHLVVKLVRSCRKDERSVSSKFWNMF